MSSAPDVQAAWHAGYAIGARHAEERAVEVATRLAAESIRATADDGVTLAEKALRRQSELLMEQLIEPLIRERDQLRERLRASSSNEVEYSRRLQEIAGLYGHGVSAVSADELSEIINRPIVDAEKGLR